MLTVFNKIYIMRKIGIFFMLLAGSIFLRGSKTVKVWAGSPMGDNSSIYLPMVSRNYVPGFGTVSGAVMDAQTGQPVAEAQICYDATCVQSNSSGLYELRNIPSGYQLFSASRNGFTDLQQGVVVVSGQTTTLNFALSPSLGQGEVRIVLTWGASPRWCTQTPEGEKCVDNDLDAYLWAPVNGGYERIYWDHRGNCDAEPFACLEYDAREGSGPETMLIIRPAQSGTYKFAVHNYADAFDDEIGLPGLAPHFPLTGAMVHVYNESGLANTFSVPSSGQGLWWYVFNLTQSHIEGVNTITDAPPGP